MTIKEIRFGSAEGESVNMSGLGRVFGVSRPTIYQWIEEGVPHLKNAGRGFTFDTAAVAVWLATRERDKAIEHYGNPVNQEEMSLNEAKRRREVALALQAELSLAKERELLANIDDLMVNFTESLVEIRAKLVSMSARLTGILSHQDEDGVAKILDAEVKDMLESIITYDHKYSRNES